VYSGIGKIMKTIVLANQKGGVGKSAVAVQIAYFFSLVKNKKVLVIDFDHQRNTSKSIKVGNYAKVSNTPSSNILSQAGLKLDITDNFVLVQADNAELLKMEKKADSHNMYANNLKNFLSTLNNVFDVCIIDTNPNPDIRQLCALVVSDYVLSPIQLNQEAIDGIGDLLNHETTGIRKIQSAINPKLKFLGILPNLVEPTPFQRDNFKDLAAHFSKLLIPLDVGFAAIKKTTAIPEAQALGLPVWKLGKTSGREAWNQVKPVFEKIATMMELN
jgi:chromosome partitioning protein